jgi:hypothetical protein
MIEVLVSAGAGLDQVDPATEQSSLHNVVKQKDPALLKAVLLAAESRGSKVDVNVQNGEGLTPLHSAVELLQVR